jgi:hypothetical protein
MKKNEINTKIFDVHKIQEVLAVDQICGHGQM